MTKRIWNNKLLIILSDKPADITAGLFALKIYAKDKLGYRVAINFPQGRTLILFRLYNKYSTFTFSDAMEKLPYYVT